MARSFVIAALALAAAGAASVPAAAQFGSLFGNDPPRPPGSVPTRSPSLMDRDTQFQTTNYPPPAATPAAPGAVPGPAGAGDAPPMGSIEAQPLPPPPGAAAPVPNAAPASAGLPAPTGAPAPAGAPAPTGAPMPAGAPAPAGGPAGATPPNGATPSGPSSGEPATAAAPPTDEVVTEPPAAKIVNPVAVFAGLDKITGRIISFEVKMGETVQFGALQVTPRACYTRPPTERANTDGFVEVDEVTLEGKVKRIFTGWMFTASPGLHAVEHPIYDVWLTDCTGGAQTVTAEAPSETTPAAAPARNQRTQQSPPAARRSPPAVAPAPGFAPAPR